MTRSVGARACPAGRSFFWDHFGWELCNRACYYAIETLSYFKEVAKACLKPRDCIVYYALFFKEQNILKDKNKEHLQTNF